MSHLLRHRRDLLLALCCALAVLAFSASVARPAGEATAAWERVELTALGDIEAAQALVVALGGEVEVVSQQRIQARVAPAGRRALEASRDVVRVERPGLMLPLQQFVPALELIGAVRWHRAGFTGHRVRVAVLDSGFAGYQQALGVTLPAQVTTRSFRADGGFEGTDHGRRAAEIVHQVAPGASLYLVNFSTVTELSAAVDYLIAEGVQAVSFSLGYIHNGPGNGTGPVNDIVSRATDAGIVWAVAAGNWAQQHWGGLFTDADGDSIHEFRPGTQQNGHHFVQGDLITVSLRWEDTWGGACSDYDIELFGPDGSLIRASRTIQACSGDPVESLQVLATQTGTYSVRVIQARSETPKRLSLMVVGTPDRGNPLTVATPGRSISEPADHAAVITVGALTSSAVRTEAPFSSRGPTADGRTKPTVLAPTGIGALTGAPFAGTSAAAPHVAGVVALLREAFPAATRAQIHGLVQARSVFVPPVPDGTLGIRRVDAGSLSGLGLLLPSGASEAVVLGQLPEEAGLALLQYIGPDGYPVRFFHLLTGGRPVGAVFAFDLAEQRWDVWLRLAPSWVSTLQQVNSGTFVVVRLE